jgi:hypothetical protein
MAWIRALTLWQPWASAVIIGGKDVENRTWSTGYRGPLVIHAAKRKPTTRELVSFTDMLMDFVCDDREAGAALAVKILRHAETRRGGIVGRVQVVDCVDDHDSRWFGGPHAMVLADPEELPFKEVVGQRGFFGVML